MRGMQEFYGNKRTGLLMLCMFLSTMLLAQTNKSNAGLLYWAKDRRLTLDDFQATRSTGDTIFIRLGKGADPHRLGVILTAIDVQVRTEPSRTLFTIRAVMDKKSSWIRGEGDTVSLQHEQGHFDICEIYTRIMRRELRKATTQAQSKVIYEKVLAAESAEQDAFDRENTFEQGGITQAWKDRIARRLRQLESFSNPVVRMAGGKP